MALVGASDRPGSVGQVVAANLLAGGFRGEIGLVDASGRPVLGRPVAKCVADLTFSPDLAVIATPAASIPGLVVELGRKGCQAAVVLSAGFEGDGADGLRRDLLAAARASGVRLVGPNCLGLISTSHGVNASFVRGSPPEGSIGLVAQSGAVAAAALDWAPAHGLGFSHVVTLGDALDIDLGDVLDLMARDTSTRAILVYVESIGHARKFMSTARFAASAKPVVVLKGGRSASGASAAFSHTRALAGAGLAYSAAFRRAGLLEVESLEDLLAAGLMLAGGWPNCSESLAILTNGGGAGVLAADALDRIGGGLAKLSEATQASLQAGLPAMAACRNPVDILGDADPARYARSLRALLAAPEVDAVLAINCPTAVADSAAAASAVIAEKAEASSPKPLVAAWLGETHVADARARLSAARVPHFETPEAAVRGVRLANEARRRRDLLAEAPGAAEVPTVVRAIVEAALQDRRAALSPGDIQKLLEAYDVPFAQLVEVASPAAAGRASADLGGDVALKIRSPDLVHKSDLGGVQLGLKGASATYRAARQMRARLQALRPDARLDGFIVQPMVRRPKAEELLVGMTRDPVFGPLILVGHGGVAAEVRADRAAGLPPLNRLLARDMIGQTRVARLLGGYRDRPPANLDALADLLVAVARLAMDAPEIAELDLNPVLCDAEGVIVVDARVRLEAPGQDRLEAPVQPYPAHKTRSIDVGGEILRLRPIRPADAAGLVAMVDLSSPEDVRRRFGGGLRHLDLTFAQRLSQIDYDRHLAIVAETSSGAVAGVGRLITDTPGESAEFALMVRSDHQQHGLGHVLLKLLLEHARERGLKQVWGDIARENIAMIDVARDLGFKAEPMAPGDDPARMIMTISLEGLSF